MPDILLLCEYGRLNGAERSMLATLGGVRAAGLSVVVMAPRSGPLAERLRGEGVELVPFDARAADGEHRPQGDLRHELAELLVRVRPRLLHANSLSMGRLSGPVAAELGLASIAHLRDIVRLSDRAVADLNCHTRLLAVSQAVWDYHVGGGLAAEKVHVLYNGVDLERFRPRTASGYLHRELGLGPNVRLVGAIGQIGPRKGQDVLMRAAAEVADRLPEVDYLIVGERHSAKDEAREFEAEVRATAAERMAGRVHFLGYRDDIERLLSELTLLVHPARQEPLGRVLLEAAAAGVPMIATAVGGTAEIFPPHACAAQLVAADDAMPLAAAMAELMTDEPRRRRLGAAARRRAEEAFDIRQAAAGLMQHYREVCL